MPSTPRTAETAATGAALLEVAGLDTVFATPEGEVRAVNEVSFTVAEGESLGVVGESGSGKTQIFLSIMGLLAANGRASGAARFRGRNMLELDRAALNQVRGNRMAMVFQDPMTSLNPYLTVRRQLTEVLVQHKGMSEGAALAAAIAMLKQVQIPEAERRIEMYPHEFSGGMRQRVMIAMALLCQPEVLIADEPTTALDVTVQAQILELIGELRRASHTAIILITHDLGVVAGLCDRVMVMYAGRTVEEGPVRDIFYSPRHPYTAGLLHSLPRLDETKAERLVAIPGQPPNLQRLPQGCAFQDRCPRCQPLCRSERPMLRQIEPGRTVACHRAES